MGNSKEIIKKLRSIQGHQDDIAFYRERNEKLRSGEMGVFGYAVSTIKRKASKVASSQPVKNVQSFAQKYRKGDTSLYDDIHFKF